MSDDDNVKAQKVLDAWKAKHLRIKRLNHVRMLGLVIQAVVSIDAFSMQLFCHISLECTLIIIVAALLFSQSINLLIHFHIKHIIYKEKEP